MPQRRTYATARLPSKTGGAGRGLHGFAGPRSDDCTHGKHSRKDNRLHGENAGGVLGGLAVRQMHDFKERHDESKA